MKPGEVLTPAMIISGIASGEVTDKGIKRAVELGKIRKITAVQPPELVKAIQALNGALTEYENFCRSPVPFVSVKKSRTRGGSTPGEIGEGKKSEVTATIHAIDEGAEVKFNGRRVYGNLSNGTPFDYDAYGQSFPTALAKMVR